MARTACQCAEAKPRRHKIEIQESSPTTDAIGGQSGRWDNPTTITTAMAAIEPIRGGERFRAQQVQSPVTHRITLRYRQGVTTAHRIRWLDRGTERIFNIDAALDIEERHKILEIMAVENKPT